MGSNTHTLVIDIGSYQLKCGYLGEINPRLYIEPIIGQETRRNVTGFGKDKFYGIDAKTKYSLEFFYPIKEGMITDSDHFIDLFQFICNRLHVNINGSSIVLTEATLQQSATKEKIAQILFEQLQVKNLCVPDQFKLVLEALDINSGLVLQSGHCITHTVPIFEGRSAPYAVCRLPFGGDNITLSLMQLMGERGFVFKSLEDFKCAECIKEKYCRARLPQQMSMANDDLIDTKQRSSDEQIYKIGSERFYAAEQLFQMVNSEFQGVQDMVTHSINQCKDDERSNIKNIILSGGTTLIHGFGPRLKLELGSSFGNLNIIEPPDRTNLSYIGGAKLKDPSSNNNLWINVDEYLENGSSILQRKGF